MSFWRHRAYQEIGLKEISFICYSSEQSYSMIWNVFLFGRQKWYWTCWLLFKIDSRVLERFLMPIWYWSPCIYRSVLVNAIALKTLHFLIKNATHPAAIKDRKLKLLVYLPNPKPYYKLSPPCIWEGLYYVVSNKTILNPFGHVTFHYWIWWTKLWKDNYILVKFT